VVHPWKWTTFILETLGIPDPGSHITYSWVVMLFLIGLAFMMSKRISIVPGRIQTLLESIFSAINDLAETIIGPEARRFFPLIGTLTMFIFFCNILGLLPSFDSPTNNLNTTVACALVVFFFYNYVGIRAHGISYIKHFMGPVWWLAPLMFPIEIISHLARPLSLSMRLFGNIFGEDLALIVLFGLVPFLVPLPLMVLAVFTSALQTFVFIILTIIYLSGAVEEAH
jgi:F-type H+-transporting ATPase subunit a